MKNLYLLLTTGLACWLTAQTPTPAFELTCDQTETANSAWRKPTSGVSYVEDIFNKANQALAISNNHNGMRLDFANQLSLKQQGTIEFYFKYSNRHNFYTDGVNQSYPIFFIYNNSSNTLNKDAFSFGVDGNYKLYAKSGNRFRVTSNEDYGWQKWQHYVITYNTESNSTYFKIYRNGKLLLEAPSFTPDFSTTIDTKMYFGSYTINGTNFTTSISGAFDNIKVYASALTETQIRENFENMLPVIRGNETIMYKFENNLDDAIGTRHATTAGGTISYVSNANGIANSASSFNAHSNTGDTYAQIPTSINEKLGGKYSISFAYNLQDTRVENNNNYLKPILTIPTTSGTPTIIGLRNGVNETSFPLGVMNAGYGRYANQNFVEKNQWAYATVVFNNYEYSVYVNGERLINNAFDYFSSEVSTTQPILIGKSETPLDWFRGYIDDLIIDNRVYTSEDAVAQYYQWLRDFSNTSIDTTMGVSSNIKNNSLKLYPNPASDVLSISSNETIADVKIFSTSGQQVKTAKATNKIDIRNLAKGNYYITIEHTNGHIVTKQFIKK